MYALSPCMYIYIYILSHMYWIPYPALDWLELRDKNNSSRPLTPPLTSFYADIEEGGGYWIEEVGVRGWRSGGIVWIGNVQGGGGETSKIIQIAEKFPSVPVYCLFECFLRCLFKFLRVILWCYNDIKNKFCPLIFSNHWFRRSWRLFSLLGSSGPL